MTDIPQDVVEKVAEAICAEQAAQMGEPPGCDACDGLTGEPCESVAFARAAIQALIDLEWKGPEQVAPRLIDDKNSASGKRLA